MLIGAGVALAYADRHLAPASSTGWTISKLSGQVVNAAVPAVGLVLATCRPGNRIGWLALLRVQWDRTPTGRAIVRAGSTPNRSFWPPSRQAGQFAQRRPNRRSIR
jgi:hypothetical protein